MTSFIKSNELYFDIIGAKKDRRSYNRWLNSIYPKFKDSFHKNGSKIKSGDFNLKNNEFIMIDSNTIIRILDTYRYISTNRDLAIERFNKLIPKEEIKIETQLLLDIKKNTLYEIESAVSNYNNISNQYNQIQKVYSESIQELTELRKFKKDFTKVIQSKDYAIKSYIEATEHQRDKIKLLTETVNNLSDKIQKYKSVNDRYDKILSIINKDILIEDKHIKDKVELNLDLEKPIIKKIDNSLAESLSKMLESVAKDEKLKKSSRIYTINELTTPYCLNMFNGYEVYDIQDVRNCKNLHKGIFGVLYQTIEYVNGFNIGLVNDFEKLYKTEFKPIDIFVDEVLRRFMNISYDHDKRQYILKSVDTERIPELNKMIRFVSFGDNSLYPPQYRINGDFRKIINVMYKQWLESKIEELTEIEL